jgi:TolB-like protein
MKNRLTIIYIFLFAVIGCGPKPDIFVKKEINFQPFKTIAIMPFNNFSGQEDAGKQVSNSFLVQLLKKPFFKVVDPGEVDRVMREERIRSSDQIDYETARKLKVQLSPILS